jgi:16S rRNA (cytidine1402-2'-O)-methyltransferase
MIGTLFLIPTPIDDRSPLEQTAKILLESAVENKDIICVEELKEGRRRWIRFGLNKSSIDDFILYNEHTRDTEREVLVKHLKAGKNVFLMSDCGLPAFCDPGQDIVSRCHDLGIKVTSAPFANSIALAVALSGFDHSRFIFEGFLSAKKELRDKEIRRVALQKEVTILMDTPYRMKKFIDELAAVSPNRMAFLGVELNQENESLKRKTLSRLSKGLEKEKKEFILVLGPLKKDFNVRG